MFAVHNHQPVGNFGHVFEDVFKVCYQPYFEVLRKFPQIKTAVHFSGPLLEWIKQYRTDYLKMVRELVAEGRVEIMSGGFYEPLLSTLPEEDAIGQIRMMNQFIEAEFGCVPRGLWLAERIWAQDLPRIIASAGIQYTVVDDTHFYYSGLEEHQMQGYYITERLGNPLFVFPISKALRYAIPFKMPEETLSALRRAKDELRFKGMTYADDGEKFGSWPDTYQWVYKEKWLEKFFSALCDNADWVETVTFSEYIDQHSPTGRIYLPMASYDEMMEWSLPTHAVWKFKHLKEELQSKDVAEERYKLFLRGGQWDNFLTKYEESNLLHKKMLYVSRKVNALSPKDKESSGALSELYRGQCNCAQWHGLFGGLYLNYLRHALYNHLIAAENLADEKTGHDFSVETLDFNLDGKDEILIRNKKMNACLAPGYGGALLELDYRPVCFNLSNVLRRREEIYHKTIQEAAHSEGGGGEQPQSIHDRIKFKEQDLESKLFFDRWERYSFLDHFLGSDTTLETFKQCRFEEQGDFAGQAYTQETSAQRKRDFSVMLKRTGTLNRQGHSCRVTIEKEYIFSRTEPEVQVQYKIINENEIPLSLWWGVEFNFTLLAGDAEDRYYVCPGQTLDAHRLNSEGVLNDVATFGMRDDWHKFQLSLSFSPKISLWRFPVETISQSEDGFERTYQGSCLLAHRKLDLPPGQSVEQNFVLNISQ
ncbi:MAG: 4-alpha-glucanotransferase [Nitrospinaceae bacterium]|nr:MAG: 4-alpha-glucanotransferase [Nitrospinaceae bacterium]